MNGLFYEYYYNGAGVAVGDFNNDDLPDIYFVSNLESNKLYINKGDLKFEDITDIAGVQGKAVFPTGVTTVDINSDGLLDIYVCASGQFKDPDKRRNELFVNQGIDKNGMPVFKEMAKEYYLDIEEFSTQAAFFDFDKDGDLDMFLINHDVEIYGDAQLEHYLKAQGELSGERLYINDKGKFIDATEETGIINNRLGYGLGLAIGDFNNDNWSDVYVSHDFSGEDHLYLNNRNGTFSEKIKEATNHISFFSMGNDAADYNNDGWLDIMSVDMVSEDNYGIKTSMSGMDVERFYNHVDLGLHYQYMFNTLQTNNGTGLGSETPFFSETAHLANISNTDWSWAPLFFDMNNDGWQDIFISNGIKRDFRNNDFVKYHKKVREELSKNKTINKEAYISHIMTKMPTRKKSNYFFMNQGDLTFSKVSGIQKIDSLLTASNGAAYADFDNDGDVDIVANNMDDFAHIYKNNQSEKSNRSFLKLKLNGPNGNTMGIGAKVYVKSGSNQQMKEHYNTRGFQSSVGNYLHFGLDEADMVEELRVVWNDGKEQVLKNIKANQTLKIYYNEAQVINNIKTIDKSKLFKVISADLIQYKHEENSYNDFEKESLLPHKMSEQGPAFAVGDLNADGMDDFYIGGALGYSGKIFIQKNDGSFKEARNNVDFYNDRTFEDVGATLFDADNDGDLDLYVVSGGNERKENSKYYQDRLYENDNGTFVKTPLAIPKFFTSGSCVRAYDYDNDGDLDLFVGGRQIPKKYPYPADSYLLENRTVGKSISFVDVSKEVLPDLERLGMVTDAVWTHINDDQLIDLVVVGEWMPIKVFINEEGYFSDQSDVYGLNEEVGWWNSVSAADFDNDGDVDLVCGNLGLNYKYKASKEETFDVYTKDFDDSGDLDIVLGYYNGGDLYPLRGRQCSSNEMPFIKDKFKSYDAFGKATLVQVYGSGNLNNALNYKASNFSSMYFENRGDKQKMRGVPLDKKSQVSSINSILNFDFNKDGYLDIIVAGNLYGSEVETPRNDASYGMYLKGGSPAFEALPAFQSGLLVDGEVKQVNMLKGANGNDKLVFVRNNDELKFYSFKQ
ncbi:VCBS repeat-containing protein [Snuella sedimenti]|uniref:VCBS repeat-containing protein n=1 Tax=Snuella sedimenti TaxID=2798802 RepID=A0A8J7LTY4_9FLAO|nr:VCBS repeat-containing protein [Snuella sedimenti]MBJ6369390.1 VCBS repeat-containing protein [Snuella sedimenti]